MHACALGCTPVINSSCDSQKSRSHSPEGNEEDEKYRGHFRRAQGHDAGPDADDALESQKPAVLSMTAAAEGGQQREYTVHQGVKPEKQHQGGHSDTGPGKGE